MKKTSSIEIMSPVGSYESLMAAIQGGAGSVYFGVGKLNMRSRSSVNFTLRDLQKITTICRKHNVKSYLTLNTVIYDDELRLVKKTIEAAVKHGATAIIASDMAVISQCRKAGMEVHLSTQCNVTNIDAIRYYAQFADVIVLARELSLTRVTSICRQVRKEKICGPSGNPLRIELFVHGALCMAVSGKCYLSLDNHNHSANRGACAQLCRKGYVVTDKESGLQLEIDNEYIMSPKDLKTIHFLDRLIKAGVSVLKIEGRGRSPEYVKTVTQCYREAVDAVNNGTFSQEAIADWDQRLNTVYNRGYWEGYILGAKTGEWASQYGSVATTRKLILGKVTNFYSKISVVEVKLETRGLKKGDQVMVIGPTTGVVETHVEELHLQKESVDKAPKGSLCAFPVGTPVRRGDKVYLVVETTPDLLQ